MVYLSLLVFLPLLCATEGETPQRIEASNQTTRAMKRVSRRESRTLPPPYLHLPVFVDSRLPLVKKEHFSPSGGTGLEVLPEPVREILLPERPSSTGAPSASAVSVHILCKNNNKVHVQVPKSMLGTAKKHRELRLGTCTARPSKDMETNDHFQFEFDLRLCGTKRTIINNQVAYTNLLKYDPPKVSGVIRRAAPFTLRVRCYYNRYQYSYKVGYTPKMRMRKIFKPMRNKAKFILTPRNAQWERLSPSDQYMLGKPMYFEAEAASLSQNERLYVHSCYATPEKAHTSKPQFLIVKNFGCMVESKESRSRFIPVIPYRNNIVRFSVDAFLFNSMTGQLYMHCTMSAGSSVPTPTTKSCNYDTKAGRWVELYGSASVCTCCDSNCKSAASTETKIISSRGWKIHPKVKATMTPNRKEVPTTTTAIKPLPKTTRQVTEWTTSQPEVTAATLMGKVEDVELAWPFGGGGVIWFEEEGEEKQVKSTAVVEEKEEEVETGQVTEWMTTSQPDTTTATPRGKVEDVEDEELVWPFGGGGVTWVEVEGEEKQVKSTAGVVEEEEEEKKVVVEARPKSQSVTSQPEVTTAASVRAMGKTEDEVLTWPFGGGRAMWVEEEGEEKRVKGTAVVEEEEEEEEEEENEDVEFIEPRRTFENIFEFDQ